MKPTDQLKAEHRAIEGMMGVLERVCQRLESGQGVEPGHLEQVLEFVTNFADKCHHGKEEDLLFPAMAEVGIPLEEPPVAFFLEEHTEGRGYVSDMSQAAARYKMGDRNASSRFIATARDYVALLAHHIEREDNVLFPLADAHLSPERQQALAAQFEAFEREEMGGGRHQELHELLHRLERIYVAGAAGPSASR